MTDADVFTAGVAKRVMAGQMLDKVELQALTADSTADLPSLLYWANRIRTARFGCAVRFCSIVPGKVGNCSEDCKWCAQSARYASGRVKPSRTNDDAVKAAARKAAANGAVTLGIVNSGCKPSQQDIDAVVSTCAHARSDDLDAELKICASLGELTDSQAAELAAAGVWHYNHNLETSRNFFGRMVTTHTYDDRLATLATARKAGLHICCGGIFGLGETWEDRIDLAITLRDQVKPDTVPLNFLNPIPGTPLADASHLEPTEILRIIAVFRFALPHVDLKIAGGREVNLRDMQSWIFYAGATSCLTGDYLTTSGRNAQDDLQMVKDLGLKVVRDLPKDCPPGS